MNVGEGKLLLSHSQILATTQRMAYEIYENHYQNDRLALVGVHRGGYKFARLLKQEINNLGLYCELVGLSLNKTAPTQAEIELDVAVESLKNGAVVIVDDVINTGRALAYSLRPFLEIRVKSIEAAVLVNRNYHKFPIMANYQGYVLPTTIQDRVEVCLEKGREFAAYLK